jgi:hypothetical protein
VPDGVLAPDGQTRRQLDELPVVETADKRVDLFLESEPFGEDGARTAEQRVHLGAGSVVDKFLRPRRVLELRELGLKVAAVLVQRVTHRLAAGSGVWRPGRTFKPSIPDAESKARIDGFAF